MLEHWATLCPKRFKKRDFDFVASVLAPAGSRCHLETLWNDPDGMREMLDLKEVFRALIESPVMLHVTPEFYFYVLVRHGFLESGLTDPDCADHVAGVLAKRLRTDGNDPMMDVTRGFTHTAPFVSLISSSGCRMRYQLQVAAGNQFLVLTGLYPDFIRKRHKLGMAPGVDFYESFAARSFRQAADHCLAGRGRSRRIFGYLADSMPQARRALNRIAEEFLFLGE